ncbi:MAG: PTS sugar transporter subunit IIA [Gammaproteobacteria bacterium]|nr:PTS sugar transporter subunit IIA [Gammaproteobacteria bacterium]
MSFENFLRPDSVLCNAVARSKKHCLEILSELLVRPFEDIANEQVFEGLIDRERLGCTGLQEGAAFPHCRIEGIESSNAALIKLSEPIDFDSADDLPVDLVFGMILPLELEHDDHADIKLVTDVLSDKDLHERLREMNSSSDLYDALINASSSRTAETRCQTNFA